MPIASEVHPSGNGTTETPAYLLRKRDSCSYFRCAQNSQSIPARHLSPHILSQFLRSVVNLLPLIYYVYDLEFMVIPGYTFLSILVGAKAISYYHKSIEFHITHSL